jgi:uncharacterized protein (UPF0335 family)
MPHKKDRPAGDGAAPSENNCSLNIIEAGAGHNSLNPEDLIKYCERIETCIEERKDINASIKQILEEADHNGFDKKTIRYVIKVRAMNLEDRQSQFDLQDAYLSALGLL